MCGRYTLTETVREVAKHLGAEDMTGLPANGQRERYNVAPSQDVPVLVHHQQDESRQLRIVKWGLIPNWVKDRESFKPLNNARADSIATKPSFRSPFAKRRILVPASGFYEWKRDVAPKQPYYIHPTDEPLFSFAGVAEAWRDPEKADDDPDRWVMTSSIITTDASDELAWMHNRMPAFIPDDIRDAWLNHDTDLDDLQAILADGPRQVAAALEVYPVSTAVNNARHQGPELIERLEPTPG